MQTVHYHNEVHHHYYAAVVHSGTAVAGNPVFPNCPPPALGEHQTEEVAGGRQSYTRYTGRQPEEVTDAFIALAAELVWRMGLADEEEGDPLQLAWDIVQRDRRFGGLRGKERLRWRSFLDSLGAEICLCVLLHQHAENRPFHRDKQEPIRNATSYLMVTLDRIARGDETGNIPATLEQIRGTLANRREAAERESAIALQGSEPATPPPHAEPLPDSRKPSPLVVEQSPDLDEAVAAIEESMTEPEPPRPEPEPPPTLPEGFDTSWAPTYRTKEGSWPMPPWGSDGLPEILALPDCPEKLRKDFLFAQTKWNSMQNGSEADCKSAETQYVLMQEALCDALEHYGHRYGEGVVPTPFRPKKPYVDPKIVVARDPGAFRSPDKKRPNELV